MKEVAIDVGGRRIRIRPLTTEGEARECASIMSTTDPWITLERDFDASLAIVRDPEQEGYVALEGNSVVGFLLLVMHGAFVGYIRTIAVREDWRSRGLGRRLIAFAEERIFRDSPNVFLCVSSFNPRARALYERLGFDVVGELRDYLVRGHSEWLLRKSIAPYVDFSRGQTP